MAQVRISPPAPLYVQFMVDVILYDVTCIDISTNIFFIIFVFVISLEFYDERLIWYFPYFFPVHQRFPSKNQPSTRPSVPRLCPVLKVFIIRVHLQTMSYPGILPTMKYKMFSYLCNGEKLYSQKTDQMTDWEATQFIERATACFIFCGKIKLSLAVNWALQFMLLKSLLLVSHYAILLSTHWNWAWAWNIYITGECSITNIILI